jgi:hypothetical protein
VDAAGWLGLVVPVVALELPELLGLLELLGLVELLEVLGLVELLGLLGGEDVPAELFVTAEVAGAVGLWLAPPDGVLWLLEGFPDRAKARTAPPAPSRMATARTRVSRTGRRMPARRGTSGGRISGGRVSGGGAPHDGVLRDEAARDGGGVACGVLACGALGCGRDCGGVADRGPAGCQVWASTVWVRLSDPAEGSAAVRVSWFSSSRAVGRACGSLSRAATTWACSAAGTAAMSGVSCRIRYRMTSEVPVPKGDCPLAA